MRIRTIIVLAGAIALAACGKSAPEESIPENEIVQENIVEDERDSVIENAAPPEPENAATPAPAPEVSDEIQMLDDADATGLTARLPQSGEENETSPAQ